MKTGIIHLSKKKYKYFSGLIIKKQPPEINSKMQLDENSSNTHCRK